jgi:hypothetical protein
MKIYHGKRPVDSADCRIPLNGWRSYACSNGPRVYENKERSISQPTLL